MLQLVIDPGTHNKSFGFESDMEKWPGRAQLEERLFHFPPNVFAIFDDFLKLSAPAEDTVELQKKSSNSKNIEKIFAQVALNSFFGLITGTRKWTYY